ncbi:junction-mediating and -regulatory protein-like [Ictalurus furcatus]|uniref:junction-mediating and -regulatory protein-like n=1 Tax=Ictalurus furcatus TaxID=66913 RepID=UPI002350FE24|nr:junction-mediating and -regulatory protein-like [Ictalurus furcatus]
MDELNVTAIRRPSILLLSFWQKPEVLRSADSRSSNIPPTPLCLSFPPPPPPPLPRPPPPCPPPGPRLPRRTPYADEHSAVLPASNNEGAKNGSSANMKIQIVGNETCVPAFESELFFSRNKAAGEWTFEKNLITGMRRRRLN